MREIKFRVWDKSTKTYIRESDIHKSPYCLVLYLDGYLVDIAYDRDKNHSEMIVEQFTGLRDKNVKEIYEGDIIEIVNNYCEATRRDPCIAVAKYKNGELIAALDVDGDEHYNHFSSYNVYVVTFEIIGNIHENPELLK